MGLDIVEIALDNLTDHRDFEKLACEVMREDGYHDIHPLGGSGDSGRDAVQEEMFFLSEKPIRTVFQFTIQDDIPGKLNETIATLRDNGIAYQHLVVACRRKITTEAQDSMEKDARVTHGVSVRVFERAAFVTHLSDFKNGIFYRHFPDIRAQLSSIEGQQLSAEPVSRAIEKSLLQASLLLTFGEGSAPARRSLFDSLVLGVLLAQPERKAKRSALAGIVGSAVSIAVPPEDQVFAALRRLEECGVVQIGATDVCATEKAIESVAGTRIRATCGTAIVADDVLARVRSAYGNRLSDAEARRIQRNTVDAVLHLFRIYGLHLAQQLLPAQRDVALPQAIRSDLVNKARYQLSPALGNLVVAAVGEVLRDPSETAAGALAAWTRAYLAVQVMGLDPSLREFQTQRLKGKVFLLDTDTVLLSVATSCPENASTTRTIESLLKYQCRVIVPESSVSEAARHAQYSFRTYNYFKERLSRLPPAFVDQNVNNVFVKAYYYASTTDRRQRELRYADFMANFLDGKNPVGFFREVVRDTLPEQVEILDPESLLESPVTLERIDALTTRLFERLATSRKARYRSREEQESLAKADAKLFLAALELTTLRPGEGSHILGGRCYLVTDSGRYLKAARDVGIQDIVTTRPQSLIALLQLIGGVTVSPSDFVRLFDNAFLSDAIMSCGSDIDNLVKSGIDLQQKSVTRLKFDLDEVLHERVLAVTEGDAAAEQELEREGPEPSGASNAYLALLSEAARRGYDLIPELGELKKTLDESQGSATDREALIEGLLEKNKALEEQIEHFGKRKQRYLRRMARMRERRGQ